MQGPHSLEGRRADTSCRSHSSSHAVGVRLARLLVAVLAILGVNGCGGSGAYPVSGKLVYEDGEPVRDAIGCTIIASCDELRTSSIGTIMDDGAFRLTMMKPNDGALPGRYKVTINVNPPDADSSPEEKAEWKRRIAEFGMPFIDPIYCKAGSSPLEINVEGNKNDITLQLKRVKKATFTPK
jgi:hypothetical protein